MLTAEFVSARRQGDELKLVKLGARQEAAQLLAEELIGIAESSVGSTRAELESAWGAVDHEPRDRKLLLGLRKLVEDTLVFEAALEEDPVALRAEVFSRAATLRRGEARFDREALLDAVASERKTDRASVERSLYADLRGEQVLMSAPVPAPDALVEGYERAQAQAVLLRATGLTARIEGADPLALRGLFRKLKFLRLLHTIRRDGTAYEVEVDGPFSLFEQVTKYGLSFALALPALASCGKHRIEARVLWGADRRPLRFVIEGEMAAPDDVPARLPDDAEALRARWLERKSKWSVAVNETILDLPGVGLCVPDLVFTRGRSKTRVHVEVLGYWSRDAVWKRVELAEAGLPEPVLFCASTRLRVSEAVLDDDAGAALLTYKGVIPLARVEEKLEALAGKRSAKRAR